jgi:hypothetical protein
MSDCGASRTDWALEEYKLLERRISSQDASRLGLRRWAVGLLSLVAGLHYVLPRLASLHSVDGRSLLAYGIFVIVGFWLLELIYYVSQDRAAHRVREIENSLATTWIGHNLRARPRAPGRSARSPRMGHVMEGEGRSFPKSLGSGAKNPRIYGFYLVLLVAFSAWHVATNAGAEPQGTVSSTPARDEHLERIEEAASDISHKLDRIGDRIDALRDEFARSTNESAPTIHVHVDPPDLSLILGPLEEAGSRLAAIETAIRELGPLTLPEPTAPAPAAECEGRAWGIGSSSLSCVPSRESP